MSDASPLHHSTFMVGERVTLRPLSNDDVPVLSRIANHPETRYALFEFLPKSDADIERSIADWSRDPNAFHLIICERATQRPVGHTALLRIDWMSRAAIFYIAIGEPTDWSKGFGGEATKLVCEHAFQALNLQRIQLHVWAKNEKGIRAYEKVGFEREGTLRRAMYHAGEYEDFLVMGLLRAE